MSRRNVVTLFCLLAFGASQSVWAQSYERESLVGLEGILIHIESKVNAEPIPADFSVEVLKTAAALRLREAGLKLTELKAAPTPTSPPPAGILVLRIWVLGPAAGVYVWSIEYYLLQGASLIRNPELRVLGGTWTYYFLGASSARDLATIVRQSVVNGAEAFANEYLAANLP